MVAAERDIIRDIEFFVPYNNVEEIQKSQNVDETGLRLVRGIASTEDWDLQKEQVLQAGIDYSYLLQRGYFNSEHEKGPANLAGEPLNLRVTPAGLYVEGFLYKGKKISDDWWEHILALELNKSNRVVGWSVQGKTLEKMNGVIRKCWLTALAITANPVNTNTWLQIVKSLDNECSGKSICGPDAEPLLMKAQIGPYDPKNDQELLDFHGAVKELQLTKGLSRMAAESAVRRILLRKGIVI